MTFYFQKKVWLGFITSIAIISWLGVTAFITKKKSAESARWVAHTNRVLYHSEEILSLAADLESGQRGYSLTGLDEFLGPSNQAADTLHDHIASLKKLVQDNPDQLRRVQHLGELIEMKLRFVNRAIQIRNTQSMMSVVTINASLEGKHLMDSIRAQVNAIQEVENQLLKSRTAQIDQQIADFNATYITMLLVTAIILILVFYFTYVNLKRRTIAEQSLRLASETIRDIYENAPCGYHSLDADGVIIEMNATWLHWLQLRREDVIGKVKFEHLLEPESAEKFRTNYPTFKETGSVHDFSLELIKGDGTVLPVLLNSTAIYDADGNFVKSRSTAFDYTEQKKSRERIEQLNQELESFSYSVSHDLRAPLRSIDGYTQILIEDYSHNLDDEGKRILNVVVNNARKMATLIDDLLNFSRIGRKDVAKVEVHMEQLVQSVLSELSSHEEGRQLQIKVNNLPDAQADPSLIRQVWVNLISNALKYTRKKPVTVIDIASSDTPGEIIYKITDNGTGFDMQYAHKLFGVFQRLHRQHEFEGTGVGLAIVHRIISRHGGRVWAEAAVDQGATFYFALPKPN